LKIVRVLAEGGFAIVYLAHDITNGTEYAVKVSLVTKFFILSFNFSIFRECLQLTNRQIEVF
jgi:serine/threonine protein kinase